MKNILRASLLAASTAMLAGCHGGEIDVTEANIQTVQARVAESRLQQLPVAVRSTGTVHSRETTWFRPR